MLLCSIVASAHDFEVDGIFYRFYGDGVAVTYRGDSYNSYKNEYSGDIVIPETVTYLGKTYSVYHIGIEAFYDCTGLTSVTIPNSVTSIGYYAFRGCSKLSSITIPNSVVSIGNDAFYNTVWYDNQPNGVVYAGKVLYQYKGTMPSGTSIDVKEGTLGISSYSFLSCTGLVSVTIPNSVTSINPKAFLGCSNLQNAVIGSGVVYDNAFASCTGLTSVTIGSGVTKIDNFAFYKCYSLKELRIEDGNKNLSLGYNAYDYGGLGQGLFYDCPLETVYLGRNISYETDKDYGYSPFYNKDKITSLTIGESVTSIGISAFEDCDGLTSITIPNSVTRIGDYAFSGCNNPLIPQHFDLTLFISS